MHRSAAQNKKGTSTFGRACRISNEIQVRAGLLRPGTSRRRVFFGVMLGRFAGVVDCVLHVPMRRVGMVGGLVVIAVFVVVGRCAMVRRCVLVMLSRFVVVLCAFVCHFDYLSVTNMAGRFWSPA
jgi:hypothetical protein